jgi:hypothetical protein
MQDDTIVGEFTHRMWSAPAALIDARLGANDPL